MTIINRLSLGRSLISGLMTLSLSTFSFSTALAQTNPIMFVTQVPIPDNFTSIGSVFGDQEAGLRSVGRGGDLWIKYPNGAYKNLTQSAGYGSATQMQGANAISVRDPSVHWDGTKALFSMVVGAPTEQYQVNEYYWQIYEITGLAQNQTPVITRVAKQPANYNNITPIYGTDGRIIFTSDRPLNGQRHLYPQLDEYELETTNTGLWSLNPTNGDLVILNHAPSGNFSPMIDSFGRVLFIQWDHLQQDQFADTDRKDIRDGDSLTYGTFNFSSEAANAIPRFHDRTEVFPEPRDTSIQLAGTNLEGHRFNHFLPWQINEDGTEMETINHLGRHELHDYMERAFTDDPNVKAYYGQDSLKPTNPNPIDGLIHIEEDPTLPGRYYGIDAPETRSHGAGQIIRLNAAPSLNPDDITVKYITHRDTSNITNSPGANHSGMYRDPLPLADGTLIASHTFATREDRNQGSRQFPESLYDFRLKNIVNSANGFSVSGLNLTPGIQKTVKYWDPDRLVTYSGPLWEWQPVEVRARTKPATRSATLSSTETQVFADAGVSVSDFKNYIKRKGLSLIICRDVTSREKKDVQQPSNLRVTGTSKRTIGASGKVYDVSYMQVFQADLIRALRENDGDIRDGRRVLGQPMHSNNAASLNPPNDVNAPTGSVEIASDGSMAALVPTQRALSWQLTDENKKAVVRERNWLTFQPGEIRVCDSCHGVNKANQAGQSAPTNAPAALKSFLDHWKATLSVTHDFDDNNDSDILWRNKANGLLWLYQIENGKINKSFKVTHVSDLNWEIAGVGDFDMDGNSDILWRNKATGVNWIYFMVGRSIVSSLKLNQVTDLNWKVAGVGDLNGDGRSDILLRHAKTGQNWVYLMNGNKITQSVLLNVVRDTHWQVAGLGDLNGDGKDDIIWRHATSGMNWTYLMNGTSISVSTPMRTASVDTWQLSGIEDFNADGKVDLLWRNIKNGENWVYLMNGRNIAASKYLGKVASLNWEIAGVRDFNGDRMADLLWRNKTNGVNFVHLTKNAKLTSSYQLDVISDRNWEVVNP